MLQLVIILLLAVHLLSMNVASFAPLAGAWLRGRRASETLRRETGATAVFKLSLAALACGAAVGGLLLVAPSVGMRAALARFPAEAYWFAGAEILFSAACLYGCVKLPGWWRTTWALALLAATNLLYHFPPLMAVLGELAADPRWAAEEVINRRTLLRLWARPEVLSLWLHFGLASIAVGCVAALACYRRIQSLSENNDVAATNGVISRRLAGFALGATLLQVPVGIWLLLASDDAAQQSMLGDDWLATASLALGVWVALGVMQSLAAIAWGDMERRQLGRACVLLVVTVVLMSATLKTSRHAGVAPAMIAAPVK